MSAAVRRAGAAAQELLWARPEWWVVGLGLLCWAWMVRDGLALLSRGRPHHDGGSGAEILHWLVMVVAMMLPTLATKARAVALRSLPSLRHWAMAEFVAGYLAAWTACGLLALAGRSLPGGRSPWAVTALCAVATAWAILPSRERAMAMVHGHAPLIAPDGWEAVRDCARSGLTVGAWCVASCWPAMLACAYSGHDLAAVAAGGTVGLVESRSFRPPRRFVIAVSALLTVFFGLR